ncbi:hypothetical protein EPIR_1018 [Erwinia piriflorinigrans CFBP 5888]|uniref:Uncharacterized protein n=1 Tax=Erwinia piriflorinigrans CFBP 5888 TaxID=1161919 RepID=V5Z513_9GAMM|nr:hypothetical protein EPIR_1018 [Erwinia piriflorinigrans CFBP 5888]
MLANIIRKNALVMLKIFIFKHIMLLLIGGS